MCAGKNLGFGRPRRRRPLLENAFPGVSGGPGDRVFSGVKPNAQIVPTFLPGVPGRAWAGSQENAFPGVSGGPGDRVFSGVKPNAQMVPTFFLGSRAGLGQEARLTQGIPSGSSQLARFGPIPKHNHNFRFVNCPGGLNDPRFLEEKQGRNAAATPPQHSLTSECTRPC